MFAKTFQDAVKAGAMSPADAKKYTTRIDGLSVADLVAAVGAGVLSADEAREVLGLWPAGQEPPKPEPAVPGAADSADRPAAKRHAKHAKHAEE